MSLATSRNRRWCGTTRFLRGLVPGAEVRSDVHRTERTWGTGSNDPGRDSSVDSLFHGGSCGKTLNFSTSKRWMHSSLQAVAIKLLESCGWIVYIWSSSTSLQSLTCSGHLGKKHAVNLYTSPRFGGLCVFSSKFSWPECEKNMNLFQNPHGTSVCCHDETNWPPPSKF